MPISILLISMFLSFIPPLSPDEQIAVSRIKDDGPFIESSSLDILINHIKTWNAQSIKPEDLPALSFSELQNNPQQYHGEAFLISGKLLRRDKYPLERNDLEAWIILPNPKNDDTETTTTLAVLLPVTSFVNDQFTHLPAQVRLPARFFALLSVPDNSQDHKIIPLPLFVGSFPQLATTHPQITTVNARTTIIIAFLLTAGFIWLIMRILSARARKMGSPTPHLVYDDSDSQPPSPPLPEEPAQALHVLHEHSQHNP